MKILIIGIMTITRKEVRAMNHWLKIDNSPLEEYLNRDFELTEKGNIKSSVTNLITAIVNPKFCQASKIFSGSVFMILVA